MTREDIEAVIRQYPNLTAFGLGVYQYGHPRPTPDELAVKFRRDQDELLGSAAVCTRICEWLASKVKTKNAIWNSYYLKHRAEKAIGQYVTNGQLIAAAVHCGFPIKTRTGSPNVAVGISARSLGREPAA